VEETILVVGGTGMLGGPVAPKLQADGYRVRALTLVPESARVRASDEPSRWLDGRQNGTPNPPQWPSVRNCG
jgi:nucleoside-diphosphate-sugar epimerase